MKQNDFSNEKKKFKTSNSTVFNWFRRKNGGKKGFDFTPQRKGLKFGSVGKE